MKEKIILWDIDKTVIDPFYEARQQALHCWEEYVRPKYPQVAELTEAKLSLPDQAALYRKPAIAQPEENLQSLKQFFEEKLEEQGIRNPQLDHDRILQTMQEVNLKKPHFYEGALACLMKLREREVRCGIVTARKQEKLPKNHPLRRFVDESLIFTKESGDKSTPEGREKLVNQLRLQAPEAEFLMIGDQPCDAWMAADLGAHYIQPLYGNDQAYIDKIRPEIGEAAAIIKEKGFTASTAETVEELVQGIEELGYMPRMPKKIPMTRAKATAN